MAIDRIMWLCALVLCVTSLLLSSTTGVDAACPCTLTADQTCPTTSCATCKPIQASCTDCYTGCIDYVDTGALDTACPVANITGVSGGFYVSHSACVNSANYQCSYSRMYQSSQCATCQPNRYGTYCQTCPGYSTSGIGPCNNIGGGGTCNDTISGTGLCQCNPGFLGTMCQYSNAVTCNNHGTVSASGVCTCSTGYKGSTCSQCTTDYYGYPACTYCKASVTCSGYGTCVTSTGACQCDSNHAGTNCAACFVPDRYGLPGCTYCLASTTCNNHGNCLATGACNCTVNHIGTACNQCVSGTYGDGCDPCPGYVNGVSSPCYGYGTCNDSYTGTGKCTCYPGFFGDDCASPSVQSITPANGPTQGGTEITIKGVKFAGQALGLVYALSPTRVQWGTTLYTDTQILAVTQPGSGSTAIEVRRDGIVSNINLNFTYDPPIITSIDPVQATAGTVVTLHGTSFGTGQQIYFGGVLQTIYASLPCDHVRCAFVVPAGVGYNINVTMFNAGKSSAPKKFSYSLPQPITVNNGTLTSGGTTVTINGANFGPNPGSQPVVLIGGTTCTVTTWSPSQIQCTAPPGRGQRVQVNVTTGGLTGSALIFYYNKPVVTGISVPVQAGGCLQSSLGLDSCPSSGLATGGVAITLTIVGTNFGPVSTTLIVVRVGANLCNNAKTITADTLITCTLPNGFGLNQTVSVQVSGQVGVWLGAGVSYASPIINPQTLQIDGQSATFYQGIRAINASSTGGGEIATFTGRNFGADQSVVWVTYGPSENPTTYNCSIVTFSQTSIKCKTVAGTGANLHFYVRVSNVPSNIVPDFYSYPLPIITPVSLHFNLADPRTLIVGNTTQGEEIYFNGANFGVPQTYLTVTYGPIPPWDQYTCSLLSTSNPDNEIHCKTSPGVGINNRFLVTVGPQTTGIAQYLGSDMYSYPVPPTVYNISGCTPSPTIKGNTVNCPTTGLTSSGAYIVLTVFGTYFGASGAQVTIGGAACTNAIHVVGFEDSRLTCRLPAGVGFLRPVVVNQGVRFSLAVPLLDYSIPSLYAVSGCTNTGNVTIDCARVGGQNLTITGQNFGVGPARVLVGGVNCDNVIHDLVTPHQKLTCVLASGTELLRTILMIQNGGEFSSDVRTVSYAQCATGWYAAFAVVACQKCAIGTYTNIVGSAVCIPCSAGTFNPSTGATVCQLCAQGTYNGAEGRISCNSTLPGQYTSTPGALRPENCPTGTYNTLPGLSVCSACGSGQYQDNSQSTSCKDCPVATAINFPGKDKCLPCEAGTATNSTGLAACGICQQGEISEYQGTGSRFCIPCGMGTYSPDNGLSQCVPCTGGTYNNLIGTTSCLSCITGKSQSASGSTACVACSSGTYQSSTGARECTDCEAGRYTNQTSQDHCNPCSIGSAQRNGASIACDLCAAGKYTSSAAQLQCLDCTQGSYNNQTGLSTCTICGAGRYSSNGPLPGSTACVRCAAGSYSGAGATGCDNCGLGMFQQYDSATYCDVCVVGRHQNVSGSTTCMDCLPGEIAVSARSVSCVACDAGKYAKYGQSSKCLECDEGTYQGNAGASACIDCALGYQSPYKASLLCSLCISGRFANSTGTNACSPCVIGTYSTLAEQATGISGCTDCQPGRYNPYTSQSFCSECDAGYYNDVPRNTQCTPCDEGTYMPTTGASVCTNCEPGRYQATTTQKTCIDCLAGRYQSLNRSTACIDCPPGSVSPKDGYASCLQCLAGELQPDPGQTDCLLCEAGTASNLTGLFNSSCPSCPPGSFQTLTGQLRCQLCPAGRSNFGSRVSECLQCGTGTYQNDVGATQCIPCASGTYVNRQGVTVCDNCAPGDYASLPGLAQCLPCEPGTYSPTTGLSDCLRCQPGTYREEQKGVFCQPTDIGYYSSYGFPKQVLCNARTVAPYQNMSSCLSCDINSDSSDDRSKCLCQVGYYAETFARGLNASVLECSGCPRGAQCDKAGITWDSLTTQAGWWRSSTQSLSFYRCLLPIHCPGGRYSNCSTNAKGVTTRTGPICALCIVGYRSSSGTSECTLCPKKGTAVGVAFVIVLAIVCVIVFLYWLVLRQDRPMMMLASERDSAGIAEWEVGFQDDVVAEGDTEAAEQAGKKGLEEDSDPLKERVLSSESRARPNFTYKMKILVGFLQIGSNLSFVNEIPWPTYYASFMSAFDIVNMDFVPWQSVGCVQTFSYYAKFLTTTLTPIAVMLGILLFYFLPSYLVDRRTMSDQNRYRVARKRSRRRFWKLVLFTIFLLYPLVSRTVLRMFVCKNIDGTSYLVADFTLLCTDPEWYKYLGVNVVMVLIYPIGIPVFFLTLMWKYRLRLMEPGVRVQVGFLYEAYNTDTWWFEMVDMAHKLMLTSLVFFFPVAAQMPAAMVTVTLYILVILLKRPYIRKGDDRLHIYVQILLFLVVFAGYILYDQQSATLDHFTDVALSVVLIFVTVGLFIVFLFMAGFNIRKMLRERQRKKDGFAPVDNERDWEEQQAQMDRERKILESIEDQKSAEAKQAEWLERVEDEINEYSFIRDVSLICGLDSCGLCWRGCWWRIARMVKCCVHGCDARELASYGDKQKDKQNVKGASRMEGGVAVDSAGRPIKKEKEMDRRRAIGLSARERQLLDEHLAANPELAAKLAAERDAKKIKEEEDRKALPADRDIMINPMYREQNTGGTRKDSSTGTDGVGLDDMMSAISEANEPVTPLASGKAGVKKKKKNEIDLSSPFMLSRHARESRGRTSTIGSNTSTGSGGSTGDTSSDRKTSLKVGTSSRRLLDDEEPGSNGPLSPISPQGRMSSRQGLLESPRSSGGFGASDITTGDSTDDEANTTVGSTSPTNRSAIAMTTLGTRGSGSTNTRGSDETAGAAKPKKIKEKVARDGSATSGGPASPSSAASGSLKKDSKAKESTTRASATSSAASTDWEAQKKQAEIEEAAHREGERKKEEAAAKAKADRRTQRAASKAGDEKSAEDEYAAALAKVEADKAEKAATAARRSTAAAVTEKKKPSIVVPPSPSSSSRASATTPTSPVAPASLASPAAVSAANALSSVLVDEDEKEARRRALAEAAEREWEEAEAAAATTANPAAKQ